MLGALVVLALGLAVAAIMTTGDDPARSRAGITEGRTTTEAPAEVTTEAPAEVTTEAPAEETTAEPVTDRAALNRDGFARMQAGDYVAALPLLREAVLALKWSNTLDEAYASYNLAYSRFAVGRCDGITGLLDRSERIQGHRSEIDELRRQWRDRCSAGSGDEGDGEAAGKKGHGKGKGKGHD